MTVIECPHGCGGALDTFKDDFCPSCRRSPSEIEIPDPTFCWKWHGPPFHRMRCRRWDGHDGECHDHPDDDYTLSVDVLADRKFEYRREGARLFAVSRRARAAELKTEGKV